MKVRFKHCLTRWLFQVKHWLQYHLKGGVNKAVSITWLAMSFFCKLSCCYIRLGISQLIMNRLSAAVLYWCGSGASLIPWQYLFLNILSYYFFSHKCTSKSEPDLFGSCWPHLILFPSHLSLFILLLLKDSYYILWVKIQRRYWIIALYLYRNSWRKKPG